MGEWGRDIFERDEDFGELGLLLEHIVQNIREGFTLNNEDALYGEADRGESQIVANVDILYTLCSHYETCPDIQLSEVEKWERDYLATFDRIFAKRRVDSPDYPAERRRYIKAAFNRLCDLVEEFDDTIQDAGES